MRFFSGCNGGHDQDHRSCYLTHITACIVLYTLANTSIIAVVLIVFDELIRGHAPSLCSSHLITLVLDIYSVHTACIVHAVYTIHVYTLYGLCAGIHTAGSKGGKKSTTRRAMSVELFVDICDIEKVLSEYKSVFKRVLTEVDDIDD